MSRFYISCLSCHGRMKRVCGKAERDDVLLYHCPACDSLDTFSQSQNYYSVECPKELIQEAIRKGVLTKKQGNQWRKNKR